MTDELSEALRSLTFDVDDPAERLGEILSRGQRRTRRRRGAVATLMALVAAAVVAGGVGVSRQHSSRPGVLGVASAPPTTARTTLATPPPPPPTSTASTGAAPDTLPIEVTGTTRLPTTLASPVVVVDTAGLAILHGDDRSEISHTAGAESPGLSHDGEYVSWLTQVAGVTTLRFEANPTLPAPLPNGGEIEAGVDGYAWSPTSDELAVCHPTGLEVRTVVGTLVAKLDTSTYCEDPVWSSDGRRLAVLADNSTDVLDVTAQGQGRVTSRLPLTSGIARFVGNGLLAWAGDGGSASIAADGLPLTDYDLATGAAYPLTTTLTYPDFVEPLGGHEYLVNAGGDREDHDGKHPVLYDIPDSPTRADPPRLLARPPVRIAAGTSLLAVASHGGSILTVTAPAADSGPEDPYGVPSIVDSADYPLSGLDGAVTAVATTNGDGDAFLVVLRDGLHLEDRRGFVSLGAIGVTPAATGDPSFPSYYSHVDPSVIIGQPAGSTQYDD